ncbi:xanthine dehydrogenase small subunit [Marinobacter nanhaiticus D15-8W]|uniref:Xanthine dehydrogenase small subunit n=1 Tax=Marinobacter nanhaiticus D15-8W TaxID=626887 RepID=N6WTM6_9GAMM|nr:xanthine dehydrogenase small subunit [Marinobacter nanhaiticus]ENO14866.1 xanthine dehydrogenase small subunit [Marinobacter nanhaiticus D15-8W]BES69440.1 xanthine dehydrogenase small subunit [Marinobacter nanhaiticus D15-8W]
MIEFFLNGSPQKLDQIDPNLSILEWLRTKMRLTGTKEGCASGDCGACTVSIGVLDGEATRLRYESVNGCIALIGGLHGKHLVTVDALRREDPVHPVQKAMIECHGAQCGFCTPGFVMSLFTLYTERYADPGLLKRPPSDAEILEALAGNLCRCTGYRPIIEAGRKACVESWSPNDAGAPLSGPQSHRAGPDWLQHPDMLAALKTVNDQASELHVSDRRCDAPRSLDALRSLKSDFPEARLIAGGTDLALEITQQLKDLDHLIQLDRIDELHRHDIRDGALYLGAGMTYRQLNQVLPGYWPHFGPMLERLGALQIRNRGTLGGNIGNASPIGDMPPALIALGAEVELDSLHGVRTLPLEDFFVDYKKTVLKPDEFVRGVRVPLPQSDEHLLLYKISKRLDDDISAVLGAFWLKLDNGQVADCRLAFGGMAAIPKRAAVAEQTLSGQPWTEAQVSAATTALAQDFQPLSDVRASASYRLQVAGNLLQRALLETTITPTPSTYPLTVTDYA